MRKKIVSKLSLILIALLIISSCEKEETPEAGFSATKVEKDGKVYVTYIDESGNNPSAWEWYFMGGNPLTSREQNPTIEYDREGIFDVKLVASNEGGSNEILKSDYITVGRFTNTMITDAVISLDGEVTIMKANSDCAIAYFKKTVMNHKCRVETSGKNIYDEQVGLLIYWTLELNFDYYGHITFSMSDDLVFLNISNNSNSDFNYFMVNRGSEYESFEEVFIPNDGITYGTGYYLANSGMEVRAYSGEGYVTWKDGYSFNIPWENNQEVDLNSDITENAQNNIIINSKAYSSEKQNNNSQLEKGSILLTESGYIRNF